MHSTLRNLGIGSVVLASILFGFLCLSLYRSYDLFTHGQSATGVVISHERPGAGVSAARHPRVRYVTVEGAAIEFTSGLGGSFIPAVGANVPVRYLRNDPSRAEITSWHTWVGSVFMLLAVVLFGGVGGLFIRGARALRSADEGA